MGNGNSARPPAANAKNKAGKVARRQSRRQQRKRSKRIGLLVPIFLGLTIAVVGVSGLYALDMLQNSSTPIFGEYEEIDLPDFTGMNYDEVMAMVKKAPLNYLQIEPDEKDNPNYPAGTVITQNPASSNENPKKVKANQKVTLVISSGVKTVEVPDVSGMSRHDAIKELLAVGLMPYAKAVRAEGKPAGIAIGTQPEAGTPIKNTPGTVVTILITSNIESYERTVPSVVGLESKEDAQRVLEAVQLQLGQVQEVEDDAPEGTVIRQYPDPGAAVMVATEVHIYIAAPKPPPVEEEPAASSGGKKPTPSSSSSDDSASSSSSSEPPSSSSEPPSSSSEPPSSSSSG